MATKRKPKAESSAEIDKLWADFEASPAQIDVPTAEQVERVFHEKGVTRRAGLALLTMSGKQLAEAVTDRGEAGTLAEVAICAREYAKFLREFAVTMECAATRISIALCNREDMQQVMREAEQRIADPVTDDRAKLDPAKRKLLDGILALPPHMQGWVGASMDAMTKGTITTAQMDGVWPRVHELDPATTPEQFIALVKGEA